MGARSRRGKLAHVTYPIVTENRLKLEATAHDTFVDDLRLPPLAPVVQLTRESTPRVAPVRAHAA